MLVGGASLGALSLVGCEGKAGTPPVGDDTGPAPTPTRSAEPAPWDAPGTLDAETFAWGIQTGDATPSSVLVSVRTLEELVTVVLVEADGETWVEVDRVEELVPDDGVVQLAFEGLAADTAYSVVATSADGQRRSVVGRVRTALAEDGWRVVTFGAVSCIAGNHPWPSLSHAAAERFDFFCLLGDTIYVDYDPDAWAYETKWDTALSTQGLVEVTASTSLVATWDDHEVANNYSLQADGIEEKFAQGLTSFRRAIPQGQGPGGTGIWRKLAWGAVLDVFVLDCRGERRDGNYISPEQMTWLKEGLSASTARFKIVLNSVPITDLSVIFGSAQETDRWSGYPAQREEILSHIAGNGIAGVLWLTGDVHYGQLGRVDPAGGTAADQWEVLCGPGGSQLNVLADLFIGAEQLPLVFAQWNTTFFTCDPGTGEVTVRWVGDDGAVIAERVLAL